MKILAPMLACGLLVSACSTEATVTQTTKRVTTVKKASRSHTRSQLANPPVKETTTAPKAAVKTSPKAAPVKSSPKVERPVAKRAPKPTMKKAHSAQAGPSPAPVREVKRRKAATVEEPVRKVERKERGRPAVKAEAPRTKAVFVRKERQKASYQKSSGKAPSSFLQCVARKESGGNIRAQNPRSTASGKYQFLDSTWRSLGYSGRAKDHSEAVQDEAAQRLLKRSGRTQWVTHRGC